MGKDANFSKVSLLLHFDGANGSTSIVDSSPLRHTVTAVGNAQISTAQGVFGLPSLAFDGAGDYCTLPDVAALEFGAGDFTVEFVIRTTQTLTYACPIARDNGNFNAGAWALLLNGNGTGSLQLWNASYSTSVPHLSTSTSPALNDGAWHHVALVRNGSAWALYVDGASRATSTWAGTMADVALPTTLGRDPGRARDFAGHLAQVRITKDLARYTANFTPPTAPHAMSGAFSGTVRDASGALAARLVRATRDDTGAFGGSTTSDAGTGAYSIPATADTAHTILAYPAAGENLPVLALRGVVPA